MELPHLGKNCALKQCNQLDFLPVKCDACFETFCLEHYQYDKHTCEKARNKNVQVPVCPLCSEPVPAGRGQGNLSPDVVVSQHIDQYCTQNNLMKQPPQKPKSNLQSCNFKSCKQKDLIYLECLDCKSKFCIKHRHPTDHQCTGPPSRAANLAQNWNSFKGSCSTSATSSFEVLKSKAQQISKSGQAALNRLGQSRNSRQQPQAGTSGTNQIVNSLQGNMTESEALAMALNASKLNGQLPPETSDNQQQHDEDLALARALHESQLMATRNANSRAQSKDTCVLS